MRSSISPAHCCSVRRREEGGSDQGERRAALATMAESTYAKYKKFLIVRTPYHSACCCLASQGVDVPLRADDRGGRWGHRRRHRQRLRSEQDDADPARLCVATALRHSYSYISPYRACHADPGELYINGLLLFVVQYICTSMVTSQRHDETGDETANMVFGICDDDDDARWRSKKKTGEFSRKKKRRFCLG